MKLSKLFVAALLAATVAVCPLGGAFAGTTTIQRSMTTTNGSGASCSQADDCGSCSISCPMGKSAICQSGRDRPVAGQDRSRCAPPACYCQ
jgi:hypothetical protein